MIKDIEKAYKLVKIIKGIDEEIIACEKAARQLINTENIVKFSFHIENLTPQKDEEDDNTHGNTFRTKEDYFRKLMEGSFYQHPVMVSFDSSLPEKRSTTNTYAYKLDSGTALMVFGFIIKGLNEKRTTIENKIEKILKKTSVS